MLPIRNISYLLPICCSFWENCKNSPKTGLGCSTPLMGQLSFSWENMYFWNHKCTFSVSFLSKFINKYKCWGCKGKFCIWSAKYMHNFRPFLVLIFKDIGFFWGLKDTPTPPLKILRGLSSLSPPCFLSLCIWLASTKPIYQGFSSEEGANFSKVDLFLIFWMWAFCKNCGVFYLRGCKSDKRGPSLNFEPFLCPKIHKIPNFFRLPLLANSNLGDFFL